MLKNAGREKVSDKNIKKYEYIHCKYCRKKLFINQLQEDGFIEEVGKIRIINCPICDESFQE